MALLSGTAAKVAIDLLRSGRAFRPGGVEMFERALRATQGAEVPESAIPEFRKLVNTIKAQEIADRLANVRRQRWGGSGNRREGFYRNDSTPRSPKTTLQDALKARGQAFSDDSNFKGYTQEAADTYWAVAEKLREQIDQLNIPVYSSWRVDGTGMRPMSLNKKASLRHEVQDYENTALLIEALARLFGDAV